MNDISSHSTSADREASAAERERRRLSRQDERKKGPCNVCGGAHHFWQCDKEPCPTCTKKWCQSRRGKVCWKLLETIPDYTDFQEKPLNKKLVTEMNDIRKAAGKPIKEASAAEVTMPLESIAESEEEDDDNFIALANPQAPSAEASAMELLPDDLEHAIDDLDEITIVHFTLPATSRTYEQRFNYRLCSVDDLYYYIAERLAVTEHFVLIMRGAALINVDEMICDADVRINGEHAGQGSMHLTLVGLSNHPPSTPTPQPVDPGIRLPRSRRR